MQNIIVQDPGSFFAMETFTRRPRNSGIFSAPNHLSNKIVLSPKIFTNTYRMELNLCQLNSVNVLLHITWTIFLGKFCKKNPFDLNIFLSHMKYGRKIKTHNTFLIWFWFAWAIKRLQSANYFFAFDWKISTTIPFLFLMIPAKFLENFQTVFRPALVTTDYNQAW